MIASFKNFHLQGVKEPYNQVTQGIRTLKQIDGTPGDQNKNENAISMQTSLGQLDAVVLSNPDNSETVIQRLTKKDGAVVTTWLEVPKSRNGVPNLDGFEVTHRGDSISGKELDVKESYRTGSFVPTRTYRTAFVSDIEAQNALMRADSVLAAYPVG